ncbi:hypothetical protein B9G55_07175 [Saccharibacillus sp. O16]|nr:hypothetical protein B9G55_07175 [Saccharibacillus sp. O16]
MVLVMSEFCTLFFSAKYVRIHYRITGFFMKTSSEFHTVKKHWRKIGCLDSGKKVKNHMLECLEQRQYAYIQLVKFYILSDNPLLAYT